MRMPRGRTAAAPPRTVSEPPPAAVRRLLLALLLNFGITSVACYALLPVLPVLLEGWRAGPLSVGAVLFLFSALRFCGFVLVDRVDFSRVRPVLTLSLASAAAMVGVAALVQSRRIAVVALLLGVAVCMSVNSVTVRTCVGEYVTDPGERVAAYARLMVVTNLCSAAGPMLGAVLFFRSPDVWLLVVAAVFALSALVTAVAVPAGLRLRTERGKAAGGWLRTAAGNREMRRTAVASFLCFVLYSQLFSAMPLYVFGTGRPALAGSLFLLNAALVVVLQVPVGRIAGRHMAHREGAFRMFGVVALFMAASFAVTGAAHLNLPVLLAGIVLFTLGETVLGAMNDQAFVAVKGELDTLSAVKSRMLVTALGQSVGAFMGGSLALATAHTWDFAVYWYAAAALGTAVAAAARLHARRRPAVSGRSPAAAP